MTQVGIALDDIVDIADFSAATMLALAAHLERSTASQELIVREIELDELCGKQAPYATDEGTAGC